MFFKKKKWYLVSWSYYPGGCIYNNTIKAANKAEAWHKISSKHSCISMIEIKEYEDK